MVLMNSKQKVKQNTKGSTNKFDLVKWAAVILLFLSGVLANYYYIKQPLSLRVIGWLILVGIMGGIALQTVYGRKALKFFREARNEMRKVAWPSRRETVQTTFIVMIIIVIFSLIIWVIDMFLMWLISWLTGQL